jgi:hypothetical protein
MKNKLSFCCLTALVLLLCACKKEEAPQPAPWDEDWFLFKATIIERGDTSSIAFSSNQGAGCFSEALTVESIWPWEDQCYYRSEVNAFAGVKIERGILYFESDGFGDQPDDTAFVNFFKSGYYPLAEDIDTGFNITYTDPDGWQYSTSEYFDSWSSLPYNYNFRIGDYHPFTRNGVQYVKVKIYFDDVMLYGGPLSDRIEMHDAEFEGYFRNN